MVMSLQQGDFGCGQAIWYTSDKNNEAPTSVFLGASGHAVATYDFFTNRLSRYFNLHALENRAAWPDSKQPTRSDNWKCFLQDYLSFLDHACPADVELIHVGHSLGASIGMFAALKCPERFSRLVLIEPGSTPNFLTHLIFRMLPQHKRLNFGLIKSTLNRRSKWPSHEAFIEDVREKQMYGDFSEEAMRDYALGGLEPNGDGYQLKFSPRWEAHIFTGTRYIWPTILKLKVPTLVLRGEHSRYVSKFIFDSYGKIARRINPKICFQQVPDAGHLAIQDNPDGVIEKVHAWLGTF